MSQNNWDDLSVLSKPKDAKRRQACKMPMPRCLPEWTKAIFYRLKNIYVWYYIILYYIIYISKLYIFLIKIRSLENKIKYKIP